MHLPLLLGKRTSNPKDPPATKIRKTCLPDKIADVAISHKEIARSSVDLLEFAFRPLYSIFRCTALDCFSVHVGDDVFGKHLGGFLA